MKKTNFIQIGKFCGAILVLMIITGWASMNTGGSDVQTDCPKKILVAYIKRISLPVSYKLEKFMITPDSKKVIILLPSFYENIYREGQHWYRFPRKAIRKEEAIFFMNQWQEQAKENPGWEIQKPPGGRTETYNYFFATQRSFYALDIKSGKWQKIKWEEGEKLFKDNKTEDVKGISPDGRMRIKKTVSQIKSRYILFMPTDGRVQKYRLALGCMEGGQEKILSEGWELEGCPLAVQWSPDSTFAIILYNNIDFEGKGLVIVRLTH